MSDLVLFSPVRAWDLNGVSVPGARARFFLANTTTPVTVYADPELTVAHPVPLEADARGVFPEVYVGGTLLDVEVTDAGDVMLPGFPTPAAIIPISDAAAASISFAPTERLPVNNVQAAIVRADQNALAPVQDAGWGVTGSVPLLADFDAIDVPSGLYRYTDATIGTRPAAWLSTDAGPVQIIRQNTTNLVQVAFRENVLWTRAYAPSAWGAWAQVSYPLLSQAQAENPASTVFGAVSGQRLAQAAGQLAVGVGQTWQNPTRTNGTSYQNTTGRPIFILIDGSGSDCVFQTSVNGSTWTTRYTWSGGTGNNERAPLSAVIPNQVYYRTNSGSAPNNWWELR
jgi:hypothetical protein